jgi:hypothetical protein
MDKTIVRQIGWVAASLGFTALLVGCGEMANGTDDSAEQGQALALTNGLANINGLALTNGLAGVNGLANTNGLALANGLAGVNGLANTNGLMTTSGGRDVVKYLVKCALAAGDTLVKQDQYNVSYTYPGAIGLCPSWKTAGIATMQTCQETISACMLAHVNTAGVHIPIWLVSDTSTAIGWGQDPNYPNQEGTFFGNIFQTNTAGHVDAYYCNGPGFDKDVVPGRLGATQTNAPYRNTFSSLYCHFNGCVQSAHLTNSVPDGYKACSMGDGAKNSWSNMVTVWRQNTAYDGAGNVIPGQTANGRTVRYDFENGSLEGWTTNGGFTLSSTTSYHPQTGLSSLKADYASTNAATLRIQGPSGLSLAAGTQVSLYAYIPYNAPVTGLNPFIKKSDGSEYKTSVPASNLLKGSWNFLSLTVPTSSTGTQVGLEVVGTGGTTYHVRLDGVTW